MLILDTTASAGGNGLFSSLIQLRKIESVLFLVTTHDNSRLVRPDMLCVVARNMTFLSKSKQARVLFHKPQNGILDASTHCNCTLEDFRVAHLIFLLPWRPPERKKWDPKNSTLCLFDKRGVGQKLFGLYQNIRTTFQKRASV